MPNLRVKTFVILVFILMAFSCSSPDSKQAVLKAELPLHLEEYMDAANIVGSEVPEHVPAAVEWSFDKSQPDWKPVVPLERSLKPIQTTRTKDALRLILTTENRRGGIYIDLPDWHREDWAYILVRARTSDKIGSIWPGFNLRKPSEITEARQNIFPYTSEHIAVIKDGSVHTYLMRADWSWGLKREGPWKQLGIMVSASESASIDILSVSVVPKEAKYAAVPVGVGTEVRSDAYRRVLYNHAPGQIEYLIRVPKKGRLDVGLGVLREDVPVTFRITAKQKGSKAKTLIEETYTNKEKWAQRSVNLSSLEGKTVSLTLEVDAERAGTVGLWAAPTITGIRTTKKPNIILYIIDGAGADYMSVYGYNRRTVPNIERLASEGAVFEHAYSNSTYTKASNPSFMTSLYHSILGGDKSDTDPLPDQAVPMAEHLHRAGYQTAVFTSNAYCGTMSSFDRGVDWLREKGAELHSTSSKDLHDDFWKWREGYPGGPYWVHFQTTDVHVPYSPVAPFSGLFVTPEQRELLNEWTRKLRKVTGLWEERFKNAGINRIEYHNIVRGLYDESMAHQDCQIGQMVERLKARGEWGHTLFIVAADHGSNHGIFLFDPLPWSLVFPLFRSFDTRIPLIIVWPERIAPGQRFSQPVSLIDMLPTILELAGLPPAEVAQGQSLAPLLLGKEGWESRPVIFDEFIVNPNTGKLTGSIEVIDGRWGASLRINPSPDREIHYGDRNRPAPLLIYDIWNDPYCLVPLNGKRPDLVKKYTQFLEAKWKEHQELAKHFSRSGEVPLTPEQLRTLRSLGYIK